MTTFGRILMTYFENAECAYLVAIQKLEQIKISLHMIAVLKYQPVRNAIFELNRLGGLLREAIDELVMSIDEYYEYESNDLAISTMIQCTAEVNAVIYDLEQILRC